MKRILRIQPNIFYNDYAHTRALPGPSLPSSLERGYPEEEETSSGYGPASQKVFSLERYDLILFPLQSN